MFSIKQEETKWNNDRKISSSDLHIYALLVATNVTNSASAAHWNMHIVLNDMYKLLVKDYKFTHILIMALSTN